VRIIVTGLIAQYPLGGVAWDYLQYAEGFRQLEHDVFYLEDSETWPYDIAGQTFVADCTANVAHLREVMERLGFAGRWAYRNSADHSYHGMTEVETKQLCASADLLVNVSGSCWLRPEYAAIPKKIFIDSDPMFTQVAMLPNRSMQERVRAHEFHFTFAENIGALDCRIPDAGIRWLPTRQPVVLDWFPQATEPPRDVWTTVMNWASYKPCEFDGETWGQKAVEFERFAELPQRVNASFELACSTERQSEPGWKLVASVEVAPDPWRYRDYLRQSKGEWSVAKEGYVKSRSGWFSCRSACYLALGRPCVLQDTGWSKIIPTGHGLFAFSTMEEAVAGITAVNADYTMHSAAARRLAEEFFDARKVLEKMLETIAV